MKSSICKSESQWDVILHLLEYLYWKSGEIGCLCRDGGNLKGNICFGEEFDSFKKLNIELTYDLAIALLGIYPRKLKTYIYTKWCRALFIIAKMWKQSKYLWTDEWRNTMFIMYLNTGILFDYKKDEALIHATASMNHDNIMLRERIQTQNTTHHILLFIWIVQTRRIHK